MITTQDLIDREQLPENWELLLIVRQYWPFSNGKEMRPYCREDLPGFFVNGYWVYVYLPHPTSEVERFHRDGF